MWSTGTSLSISSSTLSADYLFAPASEEARADEPVRKMGVTVYESIEQAKPIWRYLENTGIATAFQCFDWLEAWQRHIGERIDVEPMIITIEEDDRPVILLPLGMFQVHGLRVLRFLGGTHSNFNLGIFDRHFMQRADEATMWRVLEQLTTTVDCMDMLEMRNQPEYWMGIRNPFALLPHQSSASHAYSLHVESDFDALLKNRRGSKGRKKFKYQERALQKIGGYVFKRAETTEECHKVLEAFAAQKASRFRIQGISNVFAEPGVMEFLHELVECSPEDDARPPLELFYISVDGQIRATFAGGQAGGRFSGFFNSISTDELTRLGPGQLLLTRVLKELCDRRPLEFDLGVGEARYKAEWCDRTDMLFDTLYGQNFHGKVAASAKRLKLRIKRRIKQNEKMWAAATQVRQIVYGYRDFRGGRKTARFLSD